MGSCWWWREWGRRCGQGLEERGVLGVGCLAKEVGDLGQQEGAGTAQALIDLCLREAQIAADAGERLLQNDALAVDRPQRRIGAGEPRLCQGQRAACCRARRHQPRAGELRRAARLAGDPPQPRGGKPWRTVGGDAASAAAGAVEPRRTRIGEERLVVDAGERIEEAPWVGALLPPVTPQGSVLLGRHVELAHERPQPTAQQIERVLPREPPRRWCRVLLLFPSPRPGDGAGGRGVGDDDVDRVAEPGSRGHEGDTRGSRSAAWGRDGNGRLLLLGFARHGHAFSTTKKKECARRWSNGRHTTRRRSVPPASTQQGLPGAKKLYAGRAVLTHAKEAKRCWD